MYRILVINPGSSSTKIAVFEDERKVCEDRIYHDLEKLKNFKRVMDQEPLRRNAIERFLENNNYRIEDFDAIAARGGILEPVPGGTYVVDDHMLDYLLNHSPVDHVSNLAAVIGYRLGRPHGIPCFVVDPVSVDEMCDEARFSGIPEIERKSYSHALNIKAVARKVAEEMGRSLEEVNMVVAHLGSGISVSALKNGRMIDVNNANDEGPFSVERTGELPVGDVVKTAYSGTYSAEDLKREFTRSGGLISYLGTGDLKKAMNMMESSEKARLIVEAMAYQIAKEIGGMCAVLGKKPDAIVITGGMAQERRFVDMIVDYVRRFGKVKVIPGDMEMEALALGVLRVLRGEEKARYFQRVMR